mmetsp:Transcript_10538/g.25728  ORF Transcript_10538/g.25728 Transcript_10538/m.25728 type:complete len:239 (+) Transcript_10538:2382-3098(+)
MLASENLKEHLDLAPQTRRSNSMLLLCLVLARFVHERPTGDLPEARLKQLREHAFSPFRVNSLLPSRTADIYPSLTPSLRNCYQVVAVEFEDEFEEVESHRLPLRDEKIVHMVPYQLAKRTGDTDNQIRPRVRILQFGIHHHLVCLQHWYPQHFQNWVELAHGLLLAHNGEDLARGRREVADVKRLNHHGEDALLHLRFASVRAKDERGIDPINYGGDGLEAQPDCLAPKVPARIFRL